MVCKSLVYKSETHFPLKSKLYLNFMQNSLYNFGCQIRQVFQIRNEIICFLHWVSIKAHLVFCFSLLEFLSHLTKIFSWVGWSCGSSMFSEQNIILNRKHKANTALSFGWSLLKCFTLCQILDWCDTCYTYIF